MNFNPFRTTAPSSTAAAASPQQQQQQPAVSNEISTNSDADSSVPDDSWHTNAPLSPPSPSNRVVASAPISAPMSWFSSWTSSTTTVSTSNIASGLSNSVTLSQSAAISRVSTHQSVQQTTIAASSASPSTNDLPRSPSSFNMLRGVDSHEPEDASHTSSTSKQHTLAKEASFSARMKNVFIGSNGGGVCMPVSTHTHGNNRGDDDLYSIIADVPFFPPEHEKEEDAPRQQQQQIQQKSLYGEEELVVDFPLRQTPALPTTVDQTKDLSIRVNTSSHQSNDNTQNQSSHNSLEENQQTFPGFALYTMARVHHVLGHYTKALDTTTDCLAFQKKALLIHASNNTSEATNSSSSHSFGGNVRNLLNGNNSTTTETPTKQHMIPNVHHPIVIANSTQKMLSHYPTHACVAQTLLLRARVLAVCGLYGNGEDEDESHADVTLVHQAIQHVEMAVAMQRKTCTVSNVNRDLTQWELAVPMILLGVLKVTIHSYQEANDAYEEALLILRSVRQLHDAEETAGKEKESGVTEMTRRHAEISKRITKEMAKVLYLKGRSFQCRKMYGDAFNCYNEGLMLFKSMGASGYCAGVRRIIRCMNKSSALEKLLSNYWDDPNRI